MSKEMPKKCPKCGAATFVELHHSAEFDCCTLSLRDGSIIEGRHCLSTQRDQLAARVKELEEKLRFAESALESLERG